MNKNRQGKQKSLKWEIKNANQELGIPEGKMGTCWWKKKRRATCENNTWKMCTLETNEEIYQNEKRTEFQIASPKEMNKAHIIDEIQTEMFKFAEEETIKRLFKLVSSKQNIGRFKQKYNSNATDESRRE